MPSSLSRITQHLSAHPDGLSIEDINDILPDIPRRTLQRHLATLVSQGLVVATDKARARRYHPRLTSPIDWRSEAGREIESMVRRPLMERPPVGYQRAFLESYQPQVDSYLSLSVRQHLHQQGRVSDGMAPAGTYARQILNRLLIDLSWASSRLEGNTYSQLDTQNLIEFGQQATGKDQRETQMILNHKAAIEMLVENAEGIGFTRYTFLNLHAILSENLLANKLSEGRIRRIPVQISGTSYQPTALPQILEECFDRILWCASQISDPFEQAFFLMVQLPYLQPFEDVNKRVSRLGANIPLIQHNLIPLSFVDILEQSYVEANLGVYEIQRIELLRDLFVWAYERSCQRYRVLQESLPKPDPLRLQYRAAIAEAIREVVRQNLLPDVQVLRRILQPIVAPRDLETILNMTTDELLHLHEGNIVRVGLRLSEFQAWLRQRSMMG